MALSTRPKLVDDDNEARSLYMRARQKLLDEDFDDIAEEWIATNSGIAATHRMGIPDTAMNPIASNTRQLVTPGLYGKPVDLRFSDSASGLLGPDGHFDRAGFWQRGQTLQYLTVGIGIYFRRLNVVDIGRGSELVDRLVSPANVFVRVRDENPMEAVELWELRCRRAIVNDKPVEWYVYDQYDLETETFRIVKVDARGRLSDDVTALFVDPYVADEYDWRDPEGNAFLPYIAYRAVDTGMYWPAYRRGMHRGTLRSCEHFTYTSRSALFATGEHVLIGGVDPDAVPAVATKRGDDNNDSAASPLFSMDVSPGMLTFMPTKDQQNLQAVHIGPGVNLPNLFAFSNQYQMLLAISDGLHPTDATRQSANPTSGAALEISSESRRERMDQIKPFFHRADMECIRKAAWMFAAVGLDYDVSDVSLVYQTIPLTPTEREDLRADLQWQRDQGLMSSVDVYCRLNPGVSREAARTAIVAARVEEAELDAEVRDLSPEDPEPPADPTQDLPDPADPPKDTPADPSNTQNAI